jgi:hypothetical protein
MDQSQLNIPPEALQALQSQQGGGMDIAGILAQLSQMSPDEVSGALQQQGINVPPEQLQQAAEQWVEQSADTQASGGKVPSEGEEPADGDSAAEEPAPSPTPEGDEEEAPADEEEAPAPPAAAQGQQPMARGGSSQGMDALISAAMSQGDPDSMPPQIRGPGAGGGPSMRPPSVGAGGPPSPAAGNDPRLRAMIQSIYRQNAGSSRQGVPTGPQAARAPSMRR